MIDELLQQGDEGSEAAGRKLKAFIERAAAGEPALGREYCDAIQGVVLYGVARPLSRLGSRGTRLVTVEIVGHVMERLFKNRWALIRSWDYERNPSHRQFISLIARTTTFSVIRRRWWRNEELSLDAPAGDRREGKRPVAGLLAVDDRDDPEQIVAQRELLLAVVSGMEQQLSPLGHTVLHLVLKGCSTEEIRQRAGLETVNAVHTWQKRLVRLAREVSQELLEDE